MISLSVLLDGQLHPNGQRHDPVSLSPAPLWPKVRTRLVHFLPDKLILRPVLKETVNSLEHTLDMGH